MNASHNIVAIYSTVVSCGSLAAQSCERVATSSRLSPAR